MNPSEQVQPVGASLASGDAADYVPKPKDGWLTRKLHGFYVWRRNLKTHPLWGSLFVVLIAIAGFGASMAWQWYEKRTAEPDKLLVEIKAKQDEEFKALRASLDRLTDGEAGAVTDVRTAVRAIESTNTALMAQLGLAREEYGRLSKAATQGSGVQGGYDIILTRETGISIDSQNVLGVSQIEPSGVRVTLSNVNSDPVKEFLNSGESIPYVSADGRKCRASLLSISQAATAASFALSCS